MSIETFRRSFAAALGADATYLKLHANEKSPAGSFKVGMPNRHSEIPMVGNYGILPSGSLLILDIDNHNKGASVSKQIQAFSKVLGVDLDDTFSVDTPSGGRHFYLRIPKRHLRSILDIPKTTLRSAQEAIGDLLGYSLKVDADIRSAAANAYVVGPTSIFEDKVYTVHNDGPVRTISEFGFRNLMKLKEETTKKDPVRAKDPAFIDLWKNDPIFIERPDMLSVVPPKTVLTRLNVSLNKKNLTTYHSKRAFVTGALQCCYAPESIADVCADLGLDYDSSTNRRIPRYVVIQDVRKLILEDPYHGPYCPKRAAQARKEKEYSVADFEALVAKRKNKIAAKRAIEIPKFQAGERRVVAIDKVYSYLMKTTNRSKPTTQIQNALFLMENMVQPLSNAGASRYMLATSFIVANSHLTASQVKAALRALRAANVLRIDETPRTGLTTIYKMNDHFYSTKLTGYLRNTWGNSRLIGELDEHKPAILWNARSGAFIYAYSGAVAHRNRTSSYIARSHQEAIASNEASELFLTVARSYLRYEREWLADNKNFQLELYSEPRSEIQSSEMKTAAVSEEKLFSEPMNESPISLIEYSQLTGGDGWAPQKSLVYRPGLSLRRSSPENSVSALAPLGPLGLGGERTSSGVNSPP